MRYTERGRQRFQGGYHLGRRNGHGGGLLKVGVRSDKAIGTQYVRQFSFMVPSRFRMKASKRPVQSALARG